MCFNRITWAAAITLTTVVGAASPALSQTRDEKSPPPVSVPNTPEDEQARLHELRVWIHAYTDWKKWFDKWKGKREPGLFGPRERRTKPDPPVWLSEYCRVTPVPDGDFAIGCELFADWGEDPVAAAIKERIRSERANREAQTRTQWWSRIHIDALWMTPQVPASYGVIGVHVALKVAGRLHLFGAPGAMILNLPARDGTREWKPATDLGLSYKLVDFDLPGHTRMATLHLNFAKAWVVGSRSSVVDSSIDLIGFSFTFK